MSKKNTVEMLQELAQEDIDAFMAEYNRVLTEEGYADCVGAVGVSLESVLLMGMVRVAPELAPDEVLGKVARAVFKETQGERDVADVLGADKGAMCRMCKHAIFGALCGSEERKNADLAAGGDERFCGMVGRDVLFAGLPCKFWEVDVDEDEEDADD